MVAFLRRAGKQLEKFDFERSDPLLDPRIYALNSLRVTLFERRARTNQDAADQLNKLHVVMAQPKVTSTERRRLRPGVFETITKRQPNPLFKALAEIEDLYMQDGEEGGARARLLVRASRIIETTEEDYKANGTELGLELEDNSGYEALDAQRGILDDRAKGLNAARGLVRPLHQDARLVIPFMVAPFDSAGQRDEFIDSLAAEDPPCLPVFGNGVDPIQWQLKT